MTERILVTGATGTIGKALINELGKKGASFVAGVTSKQRGLDVLGPHVQTTVLNFEDSTSFLQSTEGITKVFLLGPPLRTDLDALLLPFVEHMKAQGIKRVVYVSALGLEEMKELPFHARVVQALQDAQFDLTILLPTFFAQNFKNYEWENIVQRGIVFVPAGTGKAGFVDVHDIALVAATVLTEDGHSGKSYTLTGSELLSYADAAQLLSEVIGKPVQYPNPSPEVFAMVLKQAGAPDFIASYITPVYSLIADHKAGVLSGDVERVTGKKPTPFKAVIERDFAGVRQNEHILTTD